MFDGYRLEHSALTQNSPAEPLFTNTFDGYRLEHSALTTYTAFDSSGRGFDGYRLEHSALTRKFEQHKFEFEV